MTKKRYELGYVEKLRLMKQAGIAKSKDIKTNLQMPANLQNIEDISENIRKIIGIIQAPQKSTSTMIYLIMYDIENNKIRTYISKYLEEKQCIRIQKSIFIAQTEISIFTEIHQTLKEVQEIYDNHDSILIFPIAADQLRALKIIGKNIDFELFQGNKNTLFF